MGYNTELYMHELDKKAFDALNAFPKLIKLKEAYYANVDEKQRKIALLSSAIKLSNKQMPEIYNALPPICRKLGIEVPELYLVNSKEINAATFGSTNPFIYITSELVEKVPAHLIPTVLAHECGHIACKHSLYYNLAWDLLFGANRLILCKIPAINRYLTPALQRTLLLWCRCSELSADRAAALCDGNSYNTVDMLLRTHGYSDNINREEYIKQAYELKKYINESPENKAIEQMLIKDDDHPVMATRTYECCDWVKTDQFRGLIEGTITIADVDLDDVTETDAIEFEVSVSADNKPDVSPEAWAALNQRIEQLNVEVDRYTNRANSVLYAWAIASGIISGVMDSMYFSDTTVFENDIGFSHRQVNEFIQEYAASRGLENDRLKDSISDLEQTFKVAQDNVWKGANIGVSAKNHHLADLAHHPTPVGLMSALIVQFLRIGTFVNKDGEWHFRFVKTTKEDLLEIAVPAVITGTLNWLVAIAENKYEAEDGKEVPEAIHKLAHLVASTPEIIEIVKCADNWFGHLVSDMGGSKQTAGAGMGIPGVFLSLLYELSSLPVLKDSGFTAIMNDLYVNGKLDLRHELAYTEQLKTQAIPVMFNEIYIRLGYMIFALEAELLVHNGFKGVNWRNVIPFGNRTVDRLLAVSLMTFNVVDTADAAMRAAIESGGNWVVFSGRFVARYNFVGAGRTAIAIVKEVSNEKKEAQLIHERMLLMDAKAQIMFEQLQAFKAELEERLTTYLAEDITAFLEGFDYINEGLVSGDSDAVIRGNVIIQKVLGREPQFTSQQEFDDLMESDEAFQF